MFNFCPNCGRSIAQDQQAGTKVTCKACGHVIGIPGPPPPKMIDKSEEPIRQGTAARCPLCQQVVEIKARGAEKTFVPHYQTQVKKICPGSGKAAKN